MKTNVVEIFNSDGSVAEYRPLSHRLPAFLDHYGPAQGYAVVVAAREAMALRPGLLRLYEAAIQAGRKPDEVGLPPFTGWERAMHFQARLLDPTGRVVATASAVKPVVQYKDHEIGETAARQRLVAALGFGGEVLDADEAQDQQDQGLVVRPSAATPAPGAAARGLPDEPSDSAPSRPPEPAPASASTVAMRLPPPAESVPETPPPDRTVPLQPVPGEPPPPALLRQIEHQARLKGLPVPTVRTAPEARQVLKQLLQRETGSNR